MVRHPFDVAISNFRYITYSDKNHRLHPYFSEVLNSDSERFYASMNGIEGNLIADNKRSKSITEHYLDYIGWLDHPNCFVIRFEDIIGQNGGGNAVTQAKVIEELMGFIGLNLSQSQITYLCNHVFNNKSRTFHKGQCYAWKEFF